MKGRALLPHRTNDPFQPRPATSCDKLYPANCDPQVVTRSLRILRGAIILAGQANVPVRTGLAEKTGVRGAMTNRETYTIQVAGLQRELPLFEVAPGLQIAVLNILGDTELVQACASALSEKLEKFDYDLLVTAEAKSIPLAHALSVETKKPYVVLRKAYKPYMGEALSTETNSITTGQTQKLFLDEKDRDQMHGKQAILLDDVISTGSTLQGMRQLVKKAGAEVVAEASIFTEGAIEQWQGIITLGHLPLFKS
jgi:adenine phosphoribosyltransferase